MQRAMHSNVTPLLLTLGVSIAMFGCSGESAAPSGTAGSGGAAVGGSTSGGAAADGSTSGGTGSAGLSAGGAGGASGAPGVGGAAAGLGGSSAGAGDAEPTTGCGSTNHPMSGEHTIDVNGTERKYILDLPPNYDPDRPYRLVFGWHPLGGDASTVANGFGPGGGYHGLESLAEGSAIFVAPNGIDQGWENTGGRDIAFARAMYEYFEANLCFDKTRVFSTGFSYGGMMSNALGCGAADLFRAIAPMSGALYSGCDQTGTLPIAVWNAHGVDDDIVPFADGKKALDVFLSRNGCDMTTTPVEPSPCVQYQGCADGAPVVFCEWNGGHQPPSFAGSAIWNFFIQF